MLTMPYLLLYEGLGPFVEAFAYLFILVLAIFGVLNVEFLTGHKAHEPSVREPSSRVGPPAPSRD